MLQHFHRKGQSIGEAVLIGRAGIRYALLKAAERDCKNPGQPHRLKKVACDIVVKLGCMTWIWWGEPCSEIGEGETCCGLDAAKLGLRLTSEVDASHEDMAEAHWLVGAHQLRGP